MSSLTYLLIPKLSLIKPACYAGKKGKASRVRVGAGEAAGMPPVLWERAKRSPELSSRMDAMAGRTAAAREQNWPDRSARHEWHGLMLTDRQAWGCSRVADAGMACG
jgi:hypothetical protein